MALSRSFLGLWFCGAMIVCAFSARVSGAEESVKKRIEAGPFSVKVRARWANEAVVENVPLQPVYRPGEWADPDAPVADKSAGPPKVPVLYKPAYANRPTHWAIRLPGLVLQGSPYDRQKAGDDETAPQILIHKADEWSGAYTDGRRDETKIQAFLKKLQQSVEKQDPTGNPAYMDAELQFVSAKKELRFVGGRGFRVLAQWTIEPELLRRGELHYLFLGLSDDNSCQVIATFPVEIPGVPDESDRKAEHLGFSTSRYSVLSENFPKYERAAKDWLERKAKEARPALDELDAMMTSLVVRGWQ